MAYMAHYRHCLICYLIPVQYKYVKDSTAQSDMATVSARDHRAGKIRSEQGFASAHTIDKETMRNPAQDRTVSTITRAYRRD
jgi:hypothetical protein